MSHFKRISVNLPALLAVLVLLGVASVLAGVYLLAATLAGEQVGAGATLLVGGVTAIAAGLLVDA